MCPSGAKADLSLMSVEVLLIVHIDDRPTRAPLHCIHVFLWIILNFPAIEWPWARSLLQLPETFACVTS